jgi:hypothetical protein
MSQKIVVLAVFPDEAAADAAALTLRESGLPSHDAVGVLVLDELGDVKTEKVGRRSAAQGAGIGLALALVTPVGLAAGLVGGGALGAFHHKGLGLDMAARDRIGAALGDGRAAVGVLAPDEDAPAIAAKLAELGGQAESHTVTDEALEAAHSAAGTDEPQ